MKIRFIISFFILLIICSSAFGAKKYVCICGNNSNTGDSPGQAYLTVQHAIDNTAAYDTLYFMPGVFIQSTSIRIIKPITIKKYSVAGEAIIDASTMAFTLTDPFIIAIINTRDVSIDSLTIRNGIFDEAKGIWVLRNSDAFAKMRNITISNCTLNNIGWISNDLDSSQYNSSIVTNAIKVEGQTAISISAVTIKNNRITNCATGWGEAVTITGNVDTFYVQNNIVDSIANIGIVAAGNYANTGAPAGVNQARNGLISGNSVSNCMSGNAISAGIYLDGSRDCIVEKNKSFKNGAGISVNAEEPQGTNLVTGHIVRNNLFYENSIEGMSIGSSKKGQKLSKSYIVNNTFYKNVTKVHINLIDSIGIPGDRFSVEDIAGTNSEILLQNSDSITFQNNIVYPKDSFTVFIGMSGALTPVIDTIFITNFKSDYNLYFNYDSFALFRSAIRNSFNAINGPQNYATIPDFNAAPARQDSNSIFADPSFFDTTVFNFQLKPCSYAIDKGNPVYNNAIHGLKDYIDSSRVFNNVRIDCGAYEYPACFIAALAGVTGGSQVCVNNMVSNTGTDYFDASCNFLTKLVPSGVSPVSGNINSCVIIDGTVQTFNAAPYVQRHYDIEPSVNPNTSTATITLYFKDQEFVNYNAVRGAFPALPTVATGGNSDPNRSRLRITQYHGIPIPPHNTGNPAPGYYSLNTSTLIIPDTVKYNTCGYWEVIFKVSGFSGFYVHTNNFNAPLPIVVNYLTGRRQGSSHLLNWKVTCSSTPRVTMILERSVDSRNFNPINNITADAVRCNQPFDYTDTDPVKGMNYYRLKMIDADGKISYSSVVALLNALKGFDIISIAPNPVVNGNFKLNVASAQSGKIELSIFDMQGRLVKKQVVSLIAGFNNIPVKADDLSAGTYSIRGVIADEQVKVLRFVKQ
ncbi:MAG: T9SS type A sorting domain-containing protein [Ferruginibacter sp.]|nr:T9SS type A sorting domain-containing protein [Ferruginibacter sp.]